MARKQNSHLNTIEYIGHRPKKVKKQFFGGWVILVIAAGIGLFFGRPLVASLMVHQVTGNADAASQVISSLREKETPAANLAVAALQLATSGSAKVTSAGLLAECYQNGMGINLRRALEDDMASAFDQYPQLWSEVGLNPEVDVTRLPNFQRFFSRSGDDMQNEDVQVGDVIFWAVAGLAEEGGAHCGIVVPGPLANFDQLWIVHVTADGVKWENKLKDFTPVRGRFRYGQ